MTAIAQQLAGRQLVSSLSSFNSTIYYDYI